MMTWQVRHIPVRSMGVTGDPQSRGFAFIPITGHDVPEGVVFTVPAVPGTFIVELHAEGREPQMLGIYAPGSDEFTSDVERREHWEKVAARTLGEDDDEA